MSCIIVPTIYEHEDGIPTISPPKGRSLLMWNRSSGGSAGRTGTPGTTNTSEEIDEEYGRSQHASDDQTQAAKSLFSLYIGNDLDNVSLLTDDFHDTQLDTEKGKPLSGFQDGLPDDLPDDLRNLEITTDSSEDEELNSSSRSNNSLFTFRRTVMDDDGEVRTRETTLQARVSSTLQPESGSSSATDETEELMSDLVKRLQGLAKSKESGVLRFPKEDRIAIKDGEKRIIFVLPQVNHAKFSKEEFGRMKSSNVLEIVRERPVIVEIITEETSEDGETLELF
jgi:hypothetical protein